MATHILLRRDTAANWTAANPVLLSGEEGLETDTGRRKIGDGVTAWTALAYEAATLANDPALKAALDARLTVAAVVTANTTATLDTFLPVDATSGAVTVTLPTGAAKGAVIVVEKEDATTNLVTLAGSIRGNSGSVGLAWQFESVTMVADASGSWWPRAGHKTKASIDADINAANLLPVIQSGRYLFPVGPGNAPVSNSLGVGTLRVAPWLVTRSMQINRIAAEVTVVGDAGSKFRIGVWADSGFGYPGNLVLDAGTIAGDSVGAQELVCAVTLTPGVYWLGGAVQNVTTTQPAIRQVASTWTPPFDIPLVGTPAPNGANSFIGHAIGSQTGAFSNWTNGPSGTSVPPPRIYVKTA